MPATRRSLAADLRALGLARGDAVMVHAGLRSVGRIVGGPDTLIDALLDAVGPAGTLLGYTDWQGLDEDLAGIDRNDIPPFDAARSRATRGNGAFPELLRTRPGARRSENPGASVAVLGGRADWFTADHPLDYGYGPGSPLARLVEADGKVLMLGAPLDTVTLLHHAEHLAQIPGKRLVRYDQPILVDGKTVWRSFEEFDTADPVVDGLPDDYFASIVEAFLDAGAGPGGRVGDAASVLLPAAALTAFAVAWLEQRFGVAP